MKKTVTLTALLIAGAGNASNSNVDVVQVQKKVYEEIKAKLTLSGLTSDQAIEVIQTLEDEIEGKPNIPGPLDIYSVEPKAKPLE